MAAEGTARGRLIRAHEPGWPPDPARRALMRYRTRPAGDDAGGPDPKFDGRVRALQQWHLDHSPAGTS